MTPQPQARLAARGSLERVRTVRLLACLAALPSLAAALVSTVLVALPQLQTRSTLTAKVAAFGGYTPLLWVLTALLTALGLAARGRRAALVMGAAAALASAALIPNWWPHEPLAPPAGSVGVRLLTLNTLYGHATPASVASLIRSEDPDVVVLYEAQQPLLSGLDASGSLAAYGHRLAALPPGYEVAREESDRGTLVLSKLAFDEVEQLATPTQQYVLRVHAARPFTLITARPRNPMFGVGAWQQDGRVLADAIRRHVQEPLVVAGDLNAVRVHATYRWYLDAGVHDASDDAGAGWRPTYPVDPFPILDLDHVLLSDQATASELRPVRADRTDHLGFVSQIWLHPRG